MKINDKQKMMIAAIVIIGGLATFMTVNVIPSQSAVAQVSISHRPAPPEPFSIAVNGHTEPAVAVTVKRGQTAQVDVLIGPKIAGISGNVAVQSVRQICGTSDVVSNCIPAGITASMSENSVSATKHMVLTISVDNNMPPGLYAYEIIADTTMSVPDQATPLHVGNISTFGIQVN